MSLRKIGKGLVTLVCVIGLVVIFGCAAMMDAVTPCFIEPDAIIYADEVPTSFMPFTSLWDAERIDYKMNYVHILNQKALERLMEDDNLEYSFLIDKSVIHQVGAREFQKAVFTPDGLIGLLIPTLCTGTLCATLISKPGDKRKITELETKLNGTKTNS